MKKTKTQEIVYGAMMLALYALFMLFDRYSGGMLYVFLYYFLPLPFVVYGMKYGAAMFGTLGFSAMILGFILGLAETAFFGVTAILVSYIIVSSIQKNWNGTKTMLMVMLVTVMSQILSVTVFATLFGYDMASEMAMITQYFPLSDMQLRVLLPFSIILMGCLEAFLFTTLTDLVLIRLKMASVPKFSIMKLHFPKIVGILYIVFFILQMQIPNDYILFAYMTFYIMMLAQGISYIFLLNALLFHKPLLNALSFIGCFIPLVNYFIAAMGIIDIFSENRKKLLYNKFQRGELR